MLAVYAPSSFSSSFAVALDAPVTKNPDIWFDAIDHVELDKGWFDSENQDDADESWFDAYGDDPVKSEAAACKAQERIPFTEDCRRCVKELVKLLGEVKERELLFAGISQLLPSLPVDVMSTAHSLYVAVTEGKNIDLAVLSTLGLVSSHLLGDGNAIASMARYIEDTLYEYVGQSDWTHYLKQEGSATSSYMFTGLAVLLMVARHWMTDELAPQRRLLRVPAFLANLLLRMNSYWGQLGRMAEHAVKTCHFTLTNDAGHHRYLCVEERSGTTTVTPKTATQPNWLCTRTEKVAQRVPEIRCAFSIHPAVSHVPDHTETTGHLQQVVAAAAETASGEVVQPLMAAAVTTVAATRHAGWHNGVVRVAALTFAATAALVGGKFIRDAFSSGRHEDEHNHASPGSPTSQALVSPAPADGADAALSTSLTFTAPLLFRNRLIGYLHAIHPFSSYEGSDLELAQATLRVLCEDEKHHAALAHIALYGTGLFGEKHDEYLEPSVQQLLVGDLLSKLLFEHRSLETYILEKFSENRRISIEDFHQKITGWSFESEDKEDALKRFFNERFLFPMMPVLNLDFQNLPPDDEKRFFLVGSATWFFIYMGTQFMSSSSPNKNGYDVEEMMLFGGYIFNMLTKGTLIDGSVQVLVPGVKLAGLFLYPEWTPDTLPELSELQKLIRTTLAQRVKEDSKIMRELHAAKESLEKANKLAWFSRAKMAEELLVKYCYKLNVNLFSVYSIPSGKDTPHNKINIRKVVVNGKTSVDLLMESHDHLYCVGKNLLAIKIPTVNYRYKLAIADFVKALRNATHASLSQLFSTRDIYRKDFSYDDNRFIQEAALTEVNLSIGRARDIREKLAFSPHVERWWPNSEYLFFNATQKEDTRTYVINRAVNDYWIRKLNFSHLLEDLRPLFDSWPPSTLHTIHVDITSNHESIRKSPSEPLSIFIERLTEKKFQDAETLLYKAGYDAPLSTLIYDFLKDVFIPFYSCVTSWQEENVDDTVVSCVLDGAFVLGPLLRGGAKIVSQALKVASRRIYIQLVVAPNFIDIIKLMTRRTITFKEVFLNSNLYADGVTFTPGREALHLIVYTLDPGILVLMDARKVVTALGKMFMSGNVLAALSHASSNWRNLIEASMHVKSLTDARKLLVEMSRATNWGGDFEMEFNRTALQVDVNYQKDASFLSLVFINNGYYNIFRLDKTEVYFPASETGEVSHLGTNIYTMLSANAVSGVFVKYICTQPVSTVCLLSPWFPPEINAVPLKPTKTEVKDSALSWTFEDEKHFIRPFVYPGHQCEIIQDGYAQSKLCEMIEFDDVHYLFDPDDPCLRPLHGGDHASIVVRRKQGPSIYFERNSAGQIVTSFATDSDSDTYSLFALDEKYRLQTDSCGNSKITMLIPSRNLAVKIKDKCFPLKLASIRNRFIIASQYMEQPSLKVGWSAKDDELTLVKPYIGESSVHVGISLEEFIGRQKVHCEGNAINKLATELVSGAVLHDGYVWLKVFGGSYRLGAWREGLCPLYCHHSSRISAWLRYDLFTESFELVHDGDEWQKAKLKERESVFEGLARKTLPAGKLSDIDQWRLLPDQSETKRLMLRLHQTAFLQRLNDVDRVALLSLPKAYLRSWKLHVDAAPLLLEYPALALGLSQFRQMTSALDGKTPNQLSLLHQMPLKNDLIGNYALPGRIIPGRNGDYEAIWIKSESVAILLKRHQFNFYGEYVTSSDGKSMWVPDVDCTPAVSLTEFMPPSRFPLLPLINLYRNEIWIFHVEWGLVTLQRDEKVSKIEYVLISPNASWIGVIDNAEHLTLFSTQNLIDSPSGTEFETSIRAASRVRIPIELRRSDFSLCMISNDGEFYYPAEMSWRRFSDDEPLWLAPLGFQPTFITSDQRFLGFENMYRSGGLIYDRHRQKAVFLRRPISEHSWSAISAVAFAPLNSLVALAFNDGQVYLYDLESKDTEIDRDPISSVQLKKLFYVDDKSTSPFKQNIVMRFTGIFRYLTIIYDMGFFSMDKAFNSKNFVYDIYGFLPPEDQPKNDD